MNIKVDPIIVYKVHLFDSYNQIARTIDHLPTKDDAQSLGESWIGKIASNFPITSFIVSPMTVIPNVSVTVPAL